MKKASHIHCKVIQDEVEAYFGIDKNLNIKSRKAELARAREIYYLLCRKFTNASLNYLAASLNRTHATVINGIKNTEWFMQHDNVYVSDYKNLESVLNIKMATFGEADEQRKNNERLVYLKTRKAQINKEIRLLESFN